MIIESFTFRIVLYASNTLRDNLQANHQYFHSSVASYRKLNVKLHLFFTF